MDDPKALIIGGAIIISMISILIYAILAMAFPEWVGITGKVARSAESSHKQDSEPTNQSFDHVSK